MAPFDDQVFTRALPKIELHAHLTGSISRETLRLIWRGKKAADPSLPLDDPINAIPPANEGINVVTFFPLFDKYIYNLITTGADIRLTTLSVLQNFAADGVVYLELRTTPRAIPSAEITKRSYVATVLDVIEAFNKTQKNFHCNLILSVDRKNTVAEASEVVNLATQFMSRGVVGIDLCGNPLKGDVSIFRNAFQRAKIVGLYVTVHFGEVPSSGTVQELQSMLDLKPDRLGHVIHVPPQIKQEIRRRRLGLELCLSCNVLANLTEGGFGGHHFKEWRKTNCPIALSTDDYGIFQSTLSNEYWLAMEHFRLTRSNIVELSRSAGRCIFGGDEQKKRIEILSDGFETSPLMTMRSPTPSLHSARSSIDETKSNAEVIPKGLRADQRSPPAVSTAMAANKSRPGMLPPLSRPARSNLDISHQRADSASSIMPGRSAAEKSLISPVSPAEVSRQAGLLKRTAAEAELSSDESGGNAET